MHRGTRFDLESAKVPRFLRTFPFIHSCTLTLGSWTPVMGRSIFFFHQECHEVSTIGIYHDESKAWVDIGHEPWTCAQRSSDCADILTKCHTSNIADGICQNNKELESANLIKTDHKPNGPSVQRLSTVCSLKRLEVFLLPPGWNASPLISRVAPSIKFTGSHL